MNKDLHTSPRTSQDSTGRVHHIKVHGELITLHVSKTEVELIRTIGDMKLRCDALYSLHRYRKSPSMNSIVDTHGRRVDFKAARDSLERFGLVVVGKHHVGVHAASVTPVETEEAYSFITTMEEYDRLLKLFNHQRISDLKRISKVQNLEGMYFVNIEEFQKKHLTLTNELTNLQNNNGNERKIKELIYSISAIEQVLNNNIQVINWRKYNEQRLYSTLTNLPKELKKNLRSKDGDFYEIDIKASQPRLVKKCLVGMLDDYSAFDYLVGVKNEEITCSFTSMELMREFHFWKLELVKELNSFNDLTEDDFYSEVCSNFNNQSRDDIKKQFMWYFFDYSLKLKGNGYAFNKFMFTKFPRINEFVRGLKKSNRLATHKKNLYSISSNLAKCESTLILKTICAKFISGHKNSSLFTVHDSINVNLKDLIDLIEIMKDAYSSADVHLSFKIKNLTTGEELNESILKGTNQKLQQYIVPSINDLILCPGDNKIDKVPYIVADSEILKGTNILKGTKRNRTSSITQMKDGRYTVKIKGTRTNSVKGESLEQFTERVKSATIQTGE